LSPLDITLYQAVELLNQPKTRGRQSAARREPIKVYDKSPITGKQVQLLDGRYGPYVTDGETNASLPKSSEPQELTFSEALDLLAERRAKGGTVKAPRKTAKRQSAGKTVTKKAAKKTATKKKSVAKRKTTAKRKSAKNKKR
jgi:DNA topoisomerase-1